jgi:MIP family channel proteins
MDATTLRQAKAEFLGTFVLIAFGAGSVAQVVLSGQAAGTYLSISLAWGLAVTMGIYVAGGVSGAHLNPAVSLALAVRGDLPWSKLGPYALAQTTGAFAGAAFVFAVYREAFDHFDGGLRQVTGPLGTAGIFATYPQPFLSTRGGFLDQVAGTALLLLAVLAIGDRKNQAPSPGTAPLVVGALVAVIGMSFGYNSGYAINPARDLGPRLFTALAGWGPDVFRAGNYWFWIPLVAPCLGALAGTFVYDRLIARAHPGKEA